MSLDEKQDSALIFALQKQVEMAVFTNDISRISNILDTEKYITFSNSQKEKYIFESLAHQFIFFQKAEEFLKYFVYEYNISDENSIDIIDPSLKDLLNPIFEKRRINKELGNELVTHKTISNKVKI